MKETKGMIVLPYISDKLKIIIKQVWQEYDFHCFTDCFHYDLPIPEWVVGDYDSITENKINIPKGVKQLINTDQMTTDSEKAIISMLDKKVKNIKIIGDVGEFVDHHLYNISLLYKYKDKSNKTNIELWSTKEKYLILSGKVSIKGAIGQKLSLFGIFGKAKVLKSKGLVYPPDNMIMKYGLFDGVSNQISSDDLFIDIEGSLLCVISSF